MLSKTESPKRKLRLLTDKSGDSSLNNFPFNTTNDENMNGVDINNDMNNEFVCDIGVVCYNLLYDTNYFNAQTINRKEMFDNIVTYSKKNKKRSKTYWSHNHNFIKQNHHKLANNSQNTNKQKPTKKS